MPQGVGWMLVGWGQVATKASVVAREVGRLSSNLIRILSPPSPR